MEKYIVGMRVVVKGTGNVDTDFQTLSALADEFNLLGLNIVILEENLGKDKLPLTLEVIEDAFTDGVQNMDTAVSRVQEVFEPQR